MKTCRVVQAFLEAGSCWCHAVVGKKRRTSQPALKAPLSCYAHIPLAAMLTRITEPNAGFPGCSQPQAHCGVSQANSLAQWQSSEEKAPWFALTAFHSQTFYKNIN